MTARRLIHLLRCWSCCTHLDKLLETAYISPFMPLRFRCIVIHSPPPPPFQILLRLEKDACTMAKRLRQPLNEYAPSAPPNQAECSRYFHEDLLRPMAYTGSPARRKQLAAQMGLTDPAGHRPPAGENAKRRGEGRPVGGASGGMPNVVVTSYSVLRSDAEVLESEVRGFCGATLTVSWDWLRWVYQNPSGKICCWLRYPSSLAVLKAISVSYHRFQPEAYRGPLGKGDPRGVQGVS